MAGAVLIASLLLVTVALQFRGIMMSQADARISVQPWGAVDGKEVQKFTLKNAQKQEVDVISYGATITAVRTPDKNKVIDDVVLGFDDITGYLSAKNPYFGATVGRVANRIGFGRFTVNGKQYQISQNIGNNTLHGGFKGWNAKVWETSIQNGTVVMALLSPDGDEGFPGAVIASISFELTDDGRLVIKMKATTTKATPINLTNHSYFNLAGHGTNYEEIYKHVVTVNADHWTVTDKDSIPTGEIRKVDNSIMDLRKPTVLGDVINQVPGGGYDYNFCLPKCTNSDEEALVAKVLHPASGRVLEVYSNQPGVQFYTGNFIDKDGISGKQGKIYHRHGALCLETQNYPDAMNHENFPNSILEPHHLYSHIVTYKFGVQA